MRLCIASPSPGTADASCVCVQMLIDIGMTDAQVNHAIFVYPSLLFDIHCRLASVISPALKHATMLCSMGWSRATPTIWCLAFPW